MNRKPFYKTVWFLLTQSLCLQFSLKGLFYFFPEKIILGCFHNDTIGFIFVPVKVEMLKHMVGFTTLNPHPKKQTW